ncbi:NADH-quinone oxidoreductase subunit NuoE [candidate division KSB3 bacterium]|uniref:NADH-quinone oxidoreductase subunit NuoE n=1 Tax=candidate division KSB3 bacterium TaxID=2044937 RepID=A0A9D5JVH9_9BACT|nr:NADH-quinone oxidoreductase subunit NuoE [candidate division KSB3 bacterium]MBD3324903.1 NADH-quinone oxidoreductase subunit NuoE [candidate division KSB3 bacterium]
MHSLRPMFQCLPVRCGQSHLSTTEGNSMRNHQTSKDTINRACAGRRPASSSGLPHKIMPTQYTDQVQDTLEKFHYNGAELVPILRTLNDAIGYLPPDVLKEVSQGLRLSESHIYGVATFYSMLSIEKKGQYVVKICESAPCHVVGARAVIKAIQAKLGINAGETTKDGKFSFELVSCLGVCGVGPVMMVNSDVYGNLTPEKALEILDTL